MATKTINISLPTQILHQIDKAARQESRTRSEYIREVLRGQFALEQTWEVLRSHATAGAQKMGIRTQKDVDRLVAKTRAEIAKQS